jgi:hypothetical protein
MSDVTINDLKIEIKEINKILPKKDQIVVKNKNKEELSELFVTGVDKLSTEQYDDLDQETKNIYELLTYDEDSEKVDEEIEDAADVVKDLDEISMKELKAAIKILNEDKIIAPIPIKGIKKEKLLGYFLEALDTIEEVDENKISDEVWNFNDSCYVDASDMEQELEKIENESVSDEKPVETEVIEEENIEHETEEELVEVVEEDSEEDRGVLAPAYNKTFKDLLRMVDEGELNTQPEFQRNSGIWKKNDKTRLIKTMLKGNPIPEIYIASLINEENDDERISLIDGQQRIGAMHSWFVGDLKGQVKSYEKLNKKTKKYIDNYPIVVRDLGDITSMQAEEIFRDLNATTYSLNKIEILNSEYGKETAGIFNTARELAYHSVFISLGLFSDTQKNRMLNIEYILMILATIESFRKNDSYFTGSNPIKKYTKEFGIEYPHADESIKKFNSVADLVEKFRLCYDGSVWTKKSALFSLFVELMLAAKLPTKTVLNKKLKAFEKKLKDITVEDYENPEKKKKPFIEFHKNISQATGGKPAREQRGSCIQKYILK